MRFAAELPELLRIATTRGNAAAIAHVGRVANARRILRRTRVDLRGYRRAVDSYGVRHTLRQHGNDRRERSRGQLAVTAADFARIPEIVSRPDVVEHAGRTKIGRETVRYHCELDGVRFTYVEEVRPRQRAAMLLTMWKRPAT